MDGSDARRPIQIFLDQARWKMAGDLIEEALKTAPDDAWLLANLGVSYFQRGLRYRGVGRVDAAIAAAPNWAYPKGVKGRMMHQMAMRLPTDRRGFFLWRPSARVEVLREAETTLRGALRDDPNDAWLRCGLASVLLDLQQPYEALEEVEAGLCLRPEDAELLGLASRVSLSVGDRADAKRFSESALRSGPDESRSHEQHGWVLLRHGDHAGATRCFLESLRLFPNAVTAKEGLQESLKRRFWVYRKPAALLSWLSRQGEANVTHIRLMGVVYVVLMAITLPALWFAVGPASRTKLSDFVFVAIGIGFVLIIPAIALGAFVPAVAQVVQSVMLVSLVFSSKDRRYLQDHQRAVILAVFSAAASAAACGLVIVLAGNPIYAWLFAATPPVWMAIAGLLGIGRRRVSSRLWAWSLPAILLGAAAAVLCVVSNTGLFAPLFFVTLILTLRGMPHVRAVRP